MSKQSRQNIIDTLKNVFISETHVDTVDTKKNSPIRVGVAGSIPTGGKLFLLKLIYPSTTK